MQSLVDMDGWSLGPVYAPHLYEYQQEEEEDRKGYGENELLARATMQSNFSKQHIAMALLLVYTLYSSL